MQQIQKKIFKTELLAKFLIVGYQVSKQKDIESWIGQVPQDRVHSTLTRLVTIFKKHHDSRIRNTEQISVFMDLFDSCTQHASMARRPEFIEGVLHWKDSPKHTDLSKTRDEAERKEPLFLSKKDQKEKRVLTQNLVLKLAQKNLMARS